MWPPLVREKRQNGEMDVGVRELRDHLSKYLSRVREGEELIVTDHGRPIARIVPVGQRPIDKAIAEGRVTPAKRPKRKLDPPRTKASGSVVDVVIDQRG